MVESIHTDFTTSSSFNMNEVLSTQAEVHVDLRPKSFEDYPGQEQVCKNLKIYTQAAKLRGRMLDHCLFHGPPGLGKTTLAGIIAAEMSSPIYVTSGPVIEKTADLMGILANLEPRSILFIDEIHRLPVNVEEVLYSAMEDRRLDVLVGQGPSARVVKLDLPPFCLIGATTRAGALSSPLRDRFGIVEHLEYYKPDALQKIILRSSEILDVSITAEAAFALAQRSRGTPRIANQLLRRVMDFAIVEGIREVDASLINSSLTSLGVDPIGLTKMDREFLKVIHERYQGGPVGLEAIASALNEERQTLEDVYEPYLVYVGFILRTPRGRSLSGQAKDHLKTI